MSPTEQHYERAQSMKKQKGVKDPISNDKETSSELSRGPGPGKIKIANIKQIKI